MLSLYLYAVPDVVRPLYRFAVVAYRFVFVKVFLVCSAETVWW
jgi:hypothetical protein